MVYECPLCHQEVSKILYDKITGIWATKEKELKKLEAKKKEWLLFKADLETNYDSYAKEIEAIHSKLKPGIKLFKHQKLFRKFL